LIAEKLNHPSTKPYALQLNAAHQREVPKNKKNDKEKAKKKKNRTLIM